LVRADRAFCNAKFLSTKGYCSFKVDKRPVSTPIIRANECRFSLPIISIYREYRDNPLTQGWHLRSSGICTAPRTAVPEISSRVGRKRPCKQAKETDNRDMAQVIPLRDLQTLSAAAILQLPGPVAVESDGRIVALLLPVRPASADARARFRQALAQAQSARTLGEQKDLDRTVGP